LGANVQSDQPELSIRLTLAAMAREVFAYRWLFLATVSLFGVAAGVYPPQGIRAFIAFYLFAAGASSIWFIGAAFADVATREQQLPTKAAAQKRAQRFMMLNLWASGFVLTYALVVEIPQRIWLRGQTSTFAFALEVLFFVLALRSMLVLPAAAAGEAASLRKAWELSAPIWIRLAALQIFAVVLGFLTAFVLILLLVVAAAGLTSVTGVAIDYSDSTAAATFAIVMCTIAIFVSSCLGHAFKTVRTVLPHPQEIGPKIA
jgi:hypothetical protein